MLPSHLVIPGVGVLHVNAFVLLAQEPVLFDTGLALDRDEFLAALSAIIDPADLRWVWISHDDADHTGALEAVMTAAPQAQLVTHALGALRMSTWWPLPLDRVHALVPGDELEVGDRTLTASRPPLFDNPTSLAAFDGSTGDYYSVDAFGAILPMATQDLSEVPQEALVGGMSVWASFDSPWTALTDRSRFAAVLDEVRTLAPTQVLSAHLPAATGRLDELLDIVGGVPDMATFVPPNREEFAQIVAQMTGP